MMNAEDLTLLLHGASLGFSAVNPDRRGQMGRSSSLHLHRPLVHCGTRLATQLLILQLLGTTYCWSQRGSGIFGPVLDFPLSFVPAEVSYSASGYVVPRAIAVLDTQRTIHFFSVSSNLEIDGAGSVLVDDRLRSFALIDLDGDGRDEIVALSHDGYDLYIYALRGGRYDGTSIALNQEAQAFVVADFNNNKRNDILLFGRSMSGVSVLVAEQRGRFVQGPLLFDDISVSALHVSDINGDAIADILLTNWLSDEIMIFYGIGRGVFSEQAAVKLPGEPTRLAVSPISRRRTYRAAVSIPEKRLVVVLEGNPLGELSPRTRLAVRNEVSSLLFDDLNDDSFPDLIIGTGSGFGLVPATSATQLGEPIWFGSPTVSAGYALGDVDGNKRKDLISADRGNQRLTILGNSSAPTMREWPSQYAVGGRPVGIALRDFSGDGLVDVAVANNTSSSISFLYNVGDGRFQSQHQVVVADAPAYIRSPGISSSAARMLVISHPRVERLTVLRQGEESPGMEQFAIQTGASPYVFFVREDTTTTGLGILARYEKERRPSVSLFEQLAGGQFVERSLRASLPERIVALTADYSARNGSYELIYATQNPGTGMTTVFGSVLTNEFEYKGSTELVAYSDPTASTFGLMPGFVDGDVYRDIILLKGGDLSAIGLLFGNPTGGVDDSVHWIHGSYPISDDAVILRDVDGDGRKDLVYLDKTRKAVMVVHQVHGRRFKTPQFVLAAPDARSIRIGGLRVPSSNDLVMSNYDRGSVTIVFDAFR